MRKYVKDVLRLSDVEHGRHNNLNLVRFILSCAVVLSHCYVILGVFSEEPMQRFLHFNDLGGTAVYSFFFLSGYLILKSALTSTPDRFVLSRVLRIFPALIVVTFFCTFLVGPLLTKYSYQSYFHNPDTYRYLYTSLLLLVTMKLPGVFNDESVNQPLWTLPSEWIMYAIMLIICIITSAKRNGRLDFREITIVIAVMIFTIANIVFVPPPWKHTIQWLLFSAAGSIVFVARKHIVLSPIAMTLAIIADIILLLSVPLVGKIIFPLVLIYTILVFGFHPALHVGWFRKLGDYSYGIYIFAWPIQKIVEYYTSSPLIMFSISLPLTLILSIFSWHLVEKTSLKLKLPRSRSA